jgi:hypothetical protein
MRAIGNSFVISDGKTQPYDAIGHSMWGMHNLLGDQTRGAANIAPRERI